MERFWSKVAKTETCWLWTAHVGTDGYGRFSLNRRMERAHRVAWALCRGPIPDGLQLDHLCRVRHCVNPDHLEPVTQAVNVDRGEGRAHKQRIKTHCPQGHDYAIHAYSIPSRPNARYCQECNRQKSRLNREANNAASRRYRARKKEVV